MTSAYPVPGRYGHRSFTCAICGAEHVHRQLLTDPNASWEAGAYLVTESGDVRWTPTHPPPEPNLAVAAVLELEDARKEAVVGSNGHADIATADTLPPDNGHEQRAWDAGHAARDASLDALEAFRVEVADVLGYVNRAEGMAGTELAPNETLLAAVRDGVRARNELIDRDASAQAELAALRGQLKQANALLEAAEADAATVREVYSLVMKSSRRWQELVIRLLEREEWISCGAQLDIGTLQLALEQWFDARPELAAMLATERQAREALQAKVDALQEQMTSVKAALDAAHGYRDALEAQIARMRVLAARAALQPKPEGKP